MAGQGASGDRGGIDGRRTWHVGKVTYGLGDRRSCRDRFRWVACQLDALRKCAKLSELRHTLNSLPKTLDDTYERILLGIDESWRDDVYRVLQWLCFALRDITLSEVVDALAVTSVDGPRFDPDERYADPRDILTRCSSLVTATYGDVLRLAHFSVKEYLVSDHLRSGRARLYAIIESNAHETIAQTCLAYLLHFKTVNLPDDLTIPNYPLAEYAASHWLKHIQPQTLTMSDVLLALIQELFEISETRRVSFIALEKTPLFTIGFSIHHNF